MCDIKKQNKDCIKKIMLKVLIFENKFRYSINELHLTANVISEKICSSFR